MSTSAEQVARLLALIPYLQQHQGVALSKVAAEFGVTAAQLRRDLEVAYFCGLPGGLPGDLIEVDMDAIEGGGVVNLSNAEMLLRPLRFTPDEAVALVLALQAIRAVAAPSTYGAVDGALAALRGLVGDAGERAVVSVAAGDDDVRAVIAGAIDGRRQVRLTYDGLARGETSYPIVDPRHVEVRDGAAYLEAWAIERGDWRTYRVDRIVAAEDTGERAVDHGTPPRRAWLDPASGAATEVTLWVSPRAAWVAEYYPSLATEPVEDGAHVVLLVADPTWLRWLLLRLGPDARVVSPLAAEASAIVAAREALAAYDLLESHQEG